MFITPTRVCFLSILLLCFASANLSALDDPPADFNKLQRQMRSAYRSGDYDGALKAARKMHELRPAHVETIYNIACLHCLLGEKDKAYEWLDKAIEAGFRDAGQLSSDADLRTIHGEDRFRAIVKRLRGDKSPSVAAHVSGRSQPEDEDEDEDEAEQARPPGKEQDEDEDEDEDDEDLSPRERMSKVNQLTQQLVQAAEAREYDKALKLALQARKLLDNAVTNYNVACMYSLMKNKDEAFKYLEIAVEKGDFPGDIVQQMEGDSDLDFLRKDERYKEILAKAGKGGKAPARRERTARAGGEGQKVAFEHKVTKPKSAARKKNPPLLVVLHPAGGNMESTTDGWKKAAAKVGAVLLTPQGTRKIGDGKYDWGKDLDEIESNINSAIEMALTEHKVDRNKIVLAGYDQGAWAAWHLTLRNPDAFCGLVPVCGRCDDLTDSAFEDDDVKDLRVFIMIGEDEAEGVMKANKSAARKLEKAGATVKLRTYEGVGHGYPKDSTEEMVKALKFVLEE